MNLFHDMALSIAAIAGFDEERRCGMPEHMRRERGRLPAHAGAASMARIAVSAAPHSDSKTVRRRRFAIFADGR
jgi:hypothetical protein